MDKSKKPVKAHYTMEANAFLHGLFHEFQEQTKKYQRLTSELLSLEAQIELAEKTLCLTREHFAMTIDQTDSATPNDWENVLRSVRFVGVRLADACKVLLQERKKLAPEQFLEGLNGGMFRFRTNSPLREIHAALLRQSFAEKRGNSYVWIGDPEQQMPLRMRILKTQVIDQEPTKKERTTDSARRAEK